MSRFITYLMLDHPAAVTAADAISSFRELAMGSPLTIQQSGAASPPLGEAFIALVNGRPVTVMFVDQPLPADAWQGAAARNVTWPQAAETAQRTRAHAIVALLNDTKDHDSAIYGAAAVTMMAAALARHLPVAAVVFSEGKTIIPAKEIVPAALSIGRAKPPLMLWTSMTFLRGAPLPDGRPTTVGLTTGLLPFIGREIEFLATPLTPAEMAQRLLGLCHYLILNGPVVKDGETVGLTEREKITVRYAETGLRPGVPAMLLSLAGPQ